MAKSVASIQRLGDYQDADHDHDDVKKFRKLTYILLSCRGYDLPDLVCERNTGRSISISIFPPCFARALAFLVCLHAPGEGKENPQPFLPYHTTKNPQPPAL